MQIGLVIKVKLPCPFAEVSYLYLGLKVNSLRFTYGTVGQKPSGCVRQASYPLRESPNALFGGFKCAIISPSLQGKKKRLMLLINGQGS